MVNKKMFFFCIFLCLFILSVFGVTTYAYFAANNHSNAQAEVSFHLPGSSSSCLGTGTGNVSFSLTSSMLLESSVSSDAVVSVYSDNIVMNAMSVSDSGFTCFYDVSWKWLGSDGYVRSPDLNGDKEFTYTLEKWNGSSWNAITDEVQFPNYENDSFVIKSNEVLSASAETNTATYRVNLKFYNGNFVQDSQLGQEYFGQLIFNNLDGQMLNDIILSNGDVAVAKGYYLALDADSSNTVSKGDVIVSGGEKFLVLNTTDDTFRALLFGDLGSSRFAKTNYWKNDFSSGVISKGDSINLNNDNSLIRPILNEYATSIDVNPLAVSLPTIGEIEGLSGEQRAYTSYYWTSSVYSGQYIYWVQASSYNTTAGSSADNSISMTVRPVVTFRFIGNVLGDDSLNGDKVIDLFSVASSKPYVLTNDADLSNSVSRGDIVSIGRADFFVIDVSGDIVKALANDLVYTTGDGFSSSSYWNIGSTASVINLINPNNLIIPSLYEFSQNLNIDPWAVSIPTNAEIEVLTETQRRNPIQYRSYYLRTGSSSTLAMYQVYYTGRIITDVNYGSHADVRPLVTLQLSKAVLNSGDNLDLSILNNEVASAKVYHLTEDNDSNGIVSVGDQITLAEDEIRRYFVLSVENGVIRAFCTESIGTSVFSLSNYWASDYNSGVLKKYDPVPLSSSNNGNIYSLLSSFASTINVSIKSLTLPTYSELSLLSANDRALFSDGYWTRSLYSDNRIYYVSSSGNFNSTSSYSSSSYRILPVVIIRQSF